MASSSNLPAFFILPSPISCILPDWSKTFQKVTRILLVDVTLSCCHRNVKEMSLSLWRNSLRAKPTRSATSPRAKYHPREDENHFTVTRWDVRPRPTETLRRVTTSIDPRNRANPSGFRLPQQPPTFCCRHEEKFIQFSSFFQRTVLNLGNSLCYKNPLLEGSLLEVFPCASAASISSFLLRSPCAVFSSAHFHSPS